MTVKKQKRTRKPRQVKKQKQKRTRKPRQVNDDPALSKDAIRLSEADQKTKIERLSRGLDINLGAL